MIRFSTLLDNPGPRPPEDVQIEASNNFSERVSHSQLCERTENSPIPGGILIVLGVATYSPPDLRLLDDVNDHYTCWSQHAVQVQVFNVLRCQSQPDFARYIPGINQDVHQTPVLAVFLDQELDTVTTGESAVRAALKKHSVL